MVPEGVVWLSFWCSARFIEKFLIPGGSSEGGTFQGFFSFFFRRGKNLKFHLGNISQFFFHFFEEGKKTDNSAAPAAGFLRLQSSTSVFVIF